MVVDFTVRTGNIIGNSSKSLPVTITVESELVLISVSQNTELFYFKQLKGVRRKSASQIVIFLGVIVLETRKVHRI